MPYPNRRFDMKSASIEGAKAAKAVLISTAEPFALAPAERIITI